MGYVVESKATEKYPNDGAVVAAIRRADFGAFAGSTEPPHLYTNIELIELRYLVTRAGLSGRLSVRQANYKTLPGGFRNFALPWHDLMTSSHVRFWILNVLGSQFL